MGFHVLFYFREQQHGIKFYCSIPQFIVLKFEIYFYVELPFADAEEAENLNAIKKLKRVKRVINGWEVEAGQWPWLVHLRVSNTYKHPCIQTCRRIE